MSEEALADSYVGLTARVWIADPSRADFLAIRSEHIRKLKARFDEKDIEVPFPQVDLSGRDRTRQSVGDAQSRGRLGKGQVSPNEDSDGLHGPS
jgi:small-conductance mechanosensitive channel